MDPSRRVVLVTFDDFQTLDLTGPNEVFAVAARIVEGAYKVEFVAPRKSVSSWSGVRIEAHGTTAKPPGRIDTLIVCGGDGVKAAQEDEELVRWIRRAAGRSRRVASVCTGAFML